MRSRYRIRYLDLLIGGVKGRTALAGERIGLPAGQAGKRSWELAGGEGIESAEATSEFGGGQAALAVEPAEEIVCGPLPFLRVAFQTAGDEVAVGIAPQLNARHDMVETLHAGGEPAETVKAEATFAGVDGLAERPGSQEIGFLEVDGAGQPGGVAGGTNLLGQAHLNQVARFAAFDQAQGALGDEAADGLTRGSAGEASTTGEPGNGKPEPEPPFEATMPQEMRIDSAVDDAETQPRDEEVLELFPDVFGVGFFVFHGSGPERARVGRLGVQKPRSLLKNVFRGHSERSEESAFAESKEKADSSGKPRPRNDKFMFFSEARQDAWGKRESKNGSGRRTATTPEGPVRPNVEFSEG